MSFTVDGTDYTLNLIAAREPAVSHYYVALCVNEPGITASGSEIDEPVGLGYRRAEIENLSGNWDVIHGQLTTTVDIDFPLADEDWGEVRYWAVCDAQEGGRVLWYDEFSDPFFIGEGDQPTIPAYGLSMYFSQDESA